MTKEEIQRLDMSHDYKKKDSPMNGWLNVIYKMMQDGHCNEVIYFYIRRQPDFSGSDGSLVRCIHLIGKIIFPDAANFIQNNSCNRLSRLELLVLRGQKS